MARTTPYSERVVVDELFDDGSARLLRSRRLAGADAKDLGMTSWRKEAEYVMPAWRVEAFVGFPSSRRLKEGDVFFLRDGRQLRATYHPEKSGIRRKDAAGKHLLIPWGESLEMARMDIKREFHLLHMERANQRTVKPKELESLVRKALDSRKRGQGGRP